MALRFVDTERYKEDWYCDLSGEYQKFWDYVCDHCDNAGIWKPNKTGFQSVTKFNINLGLFLSKINADKERIIALENGRWFILGFIKFQWFNKCQSYDLNLSNKLHKSLHISLISNGVELKKVRGLREVLETSKDKDNSNNTLSNNSSNAHEEIYPLVMPGLTPPINQPPTQQQVIEFFSGLGKTSQEALAFFHYYDATGWIIRGSPVTNFRSLANKWAANNISQREFNNEDEATKRIREKAARNGQ